jgi:hypothetical protein
MAEHIFARLTDLGATIHDIADGDGLTWLAGLSILEDNGDLLFVGAGTYTFDAALTVPDDPYDVTGWDGNLEVPTKNAIRDLVLNLSYMTEVADDTTPQLGGDLDLNGNDIDGTGNIAITGTGTFTDRVRIHNTETAVLIINGLPPCSAIRILTPRLTSIALIWMADPIPNRICRVSSARCWADKLPITKLKDNAMVSGNNSGSW